MKLWVKPTIDHRNRAAAGHLGSVLHHRPSGIAGWPFSCLHFLYDASNKPAIVEFNGIQSKTGVALRLLRHSA